MTNIKVCVTGAAGQIGYSIIPHILSGETFGRDVSIDLNLLDIEPAMDVLFGVVMEIEDCAFPLLKKVTATSNVEEAFDGIDVAILIGALPRRAGMQRSDLLKANVQIFKDQGIALNKVAKKTCKVLVVGNPVNTNAFVLGKYAPSIPRENISCLMKLDENRATAQVAIRLNVNVKDVRNVIVWGNHSTTQYPDFSQATVGKEKVSTRISKEEEQEIRNLVQNRGAAIIKARKLSSSMSASRAISDHLNAWICGSNEIISMGVWSNGEYGAPKDCVFSFPCKCSNGKWEIVRGIDMNKDAQAAFQVTADEIRKEKEQALQYLE